jgi:hypothetical protein
VIAGATRTRRAYRISRGGSFDPSYGRRLDRLVLVWQALRMRWLTATLLLFACTDAHVPVDATVDLRDTRAPSCVFANGPVYPLWVYVDSGREECVLFVISDVSSVEASAADVDWSTAGEVGRAPVLSEILSFSGSCRDWRAVAHRRLTVDPSLSLGEPVDEAFGSMQLRSESWHGALDGELIVVTGERRIELLFGRTAIFNESCTSS